MPESQSKWPAARLVVLFVVAAVLGVVSGVIFAYAATCGISRRSTITRRARFRASTGAGEIVGEFAIQRREVIPYEAISPKLHDANPGGRDDSFERHSASAFRTSRWRSSRTSSNAGRPGGQHADAAARAQLFLTDEKTWSGDQGSDPRRSRIEKRYTQARDLHPLLQPDVLRARRVRRAGASRLYFNKTAKDLSLEEAALMPHPPGNVRQSPYVNMDAASAVATTRSPDWPKSASSRRRRRRRRRRSRSCCVGSRRSRRRAPYFLEEVRKELRDDLRREAAVQERPVDSDGSRREAPGGSNRAPTTGCDGSTNAAVPQAAAERGR